MRRGFYCLTFLICLLFAAPVVAQQYYFYTYNELDGLPSSRVLDISQDTDGLMWFATARGLSRFDGTIWEDIGPDGNTPTLEHHFVGRDHQGRMWTISSDPLLHCHVFQDGVWLPIELPAEVNSSTRLTAYTLGRTPSGEVFLALANRLGKVFIYVDGQWLNFEITPDNALLGNMAFVDGQLFIATMRGLYSIDPADWKLRKTGLNKPVHTVCVTFEGDQMWLTGEGWIGRGTVDNMKVMAEGLTMEFVAPQSGRAALADQSGGVYFGDWAQVYYFHPRYGLELMSRSNGLVSNGVTQFFLDREGDLWIAGLRGVSKLVNRSLVGYDSRHGLFDDEVSAIVRRRDGEMVLGHFGGLTIMSDPPRTVTIKGEDPKLSRVSDLAESQAGELWFAADRVGIGHLRGDGSVETFRVDDKNYTGAYALAFGADGKLWVGTNLGLYEFDGENFTNVDLSKFIRSKTILIRRLLIGRDGSLLIGTGHDGILRLRDGELSQYTTKAKSDARRVYNLHENIAGIVLAGSVNGIFYVQTDSLERASFHGETVDRPVYSFLTDTRGHLWIGTDNGVLRWDSRRMTHLTNREGLLGTETNRDALQLGPHGEVWIGTDRGLTIYRAELDREALAPPLISITGFEVDGVSYPADAPLRLSQPARAIDINFRGVTFRDENRTSYRTWLENFEETWQGMDMLTSRSVRYTNVPPGEYRFHVQIRSASGALTAEANSPMIVIKPPLVKRWWFVVVLVLAGLSVLWIVASYLSGRRYARRLKVMVLERTADLERSEQHVRAESQRLGATLESISDGVITLDKENRVIMCNVAAESILGRNQAEILGQGLYSVLDVTPHVPLVPGEPTTHALTGGDGRRSWVEVSVAPINGPQQGDVGLVLAFRDITGRREIENQRARTQQLESLGVLAGGIAHDFNNLLTIILGNISLVEEATTIGVDEHGQLDKMKAATESARTLTEQFLTFAKGGEPALVVSSLGERVQQAATLAFSGASVSCSLDLAPDLWNVKVDRSQITQVLSNLFLNAGQAMPAGGTVHIQAFNIEMETADGGTEKWVRLEVHDRGVGIAKDELERIFDPYYTTKDRGTGLGLAIVHSVVRRHGGRLTVDSELGRGSVFTLALPAAEGSIAAAGPISEKGDLPPARILILDDEKDVLDVCGRMLKSLGLSCVATTDGQQTLAMYESAQNVGMEFDAVIMDLTVPGGMGGKEAVQRLLEINPRAQVIVTSGYSHDPVMANYRQFGFQGSLKKPFDKAELKLALMRVLGTEED